MTLAGRGVLAVLATTTLGVVVLIALGAPMRVWGTNLAGAGAGALLVIGVWRLRRTLHGRPRMVLGAAAASLLATTLWGVDLEGVRRWAPLGPLQLHVGFLVLPLALAALARVGDIAAPVAALAIGVALGLQPDAGSSTAFAMGVAGLAAWMRRPGHILAAIVVMGAAAIAWTRPDPLAPVRFVEGVANAAAAQGPLLAAAAVLALFAPPALLGLIAGRRVNLAPVAAPAALFWLGAAGASLIAAFPTPILGGGVGPILGYAATWGLLAGSGAGEGER